MPPKPGTVLLLLVLASVARTQAPRPPWVAAAGTYPEGLRIYEAALDDPIQAWAVVFEHAPPELALAPLVSEAEKGKEPLLDLARKAGAVAAVNASFFDMKSDPCKVAGWLRRGGKDLAAPTASVTQKEVRYPVARATVVWPDRGIPEILWVTRRKDATVLLTAPLPNRTGAPAAAPEPGRGDRGIDAALAAGPMLLRGGKPMVTREEERMFAGEDVRHPRTALGLHGKTVQLVVVDGRSAESRGVTLAGLADLLVRLGAEDAMNLDGGGSTTLVIDGRVVNRPLGGTVLRPVPTGLGILRGKR